MSDDIKNKAIQDMARALAEILIAAREALADEQITDWSEGGRLGDALISIADTAETCLKTTGHK